ncbi:MAG: ureidoglycolate lyase [Gammaproteobacteria bacterium]|nr:ureidoglycolate lyase [Gammaproteobacteria bacterium]
MATYTLIAEPLTRDGFAPFGDVIEAAGARHFSINAGAMERFHDLARVDVSGAEGRAAISIARCTEPTVPPVRVSLIERHPLGSQAFMPLSDAPFLIVVAPPGEAIAPSELKAFVSNGAQGINYHRGVWHVPLMAMQTGQEFIVVDRTGPDANCDERELGATDQILVKLCKGPDLN